MIPPSDKHAGNRIYIKHSIVVIAPFEPIPSNIATIVTRSYRGWVSFLSPYMVVDLFDRRMQDVCLIARPLRVLGEAYDLAVPNVEIE